jgi:hypothetical protein
MERLSALSAAFLSAGDVGADRVCIGVAMFSYCDVLTFGVTSDLDVTDLDVLVEGIEAGW